MLLPTRINRSFAAPFDYAQRDLESALGQLFRAPVAIDGTRVKAYPVDVREDENHLYIQADLPGFKKDEIGITLEDQTLTITAEKARAAEVNDGWLLRERRSAQFVRSFKLPTTVSEQQVNAKLENGELTITLDKREESKPRKIAVQ